MQRPLGAPINDRILISEIRTGFFFLFLARLRVPMSDASANTTEGRGGRKGQQQVWREEKEHAKQGRQLDWGNRMKRRKQA
jgi:hypothetical protein